MAKLRFTDLSGQSYNFVVSNLKLMGKYLLFVLPPIMAIEAFIRWEPEHITWPQAVALKIIMVSMFSCFALAWHRASLAGPESELAKSPFHIRKADWKFFAAFFLIGILSAVIFQAIQYVVKTQLPHFSREVRVAGGLMALFSMAFIFYETLKVSYFLPALSIGVGLNIRDVRRSSKGTIRPLMGSVFIFLVLYFVAIGVYLSISMAVIASASGQPVIIKPVPDAPLSATITSLFLLIPMYFAAFLASAMCITALSKAYRFGIENNA